jgi:hypothetical protein
LVQGKVRPGTGKQSQLRIDLMPGKEAEAKENYERTAEKTDV